MLLYGRELRAGEDKAFVTKGKIVEGNDNGPQLRFVDVGGKFIDADDRRRRIHEAQRRREARKEERGN